MAPGRQLALGFAIGLPATPLAAQALPTAAEVLAAEVEAYEMQPVNSHFPASLRGLAPEVTGLRCNVVAKRRASCRYRWRVARNQRPWTMYGEYVQRSDRSWSIYPEPVDQRSKPLIQIPHPTN